MITTHVTLSPVMGHYVASLEHLLGRYDLADASFRRALAIHVEWSRVREVIRPDIVRSEDVAYFRASS